MLGDAATVSILWKIILTDLVLSGDNAVLLALATQGLPPRQQFWGRIGGAFGAVGLRILFTAIIAQLLALPYLQALGALVLLWIAGKLVCAGGGEEGGGKKGATLWSAIGIIVLADVTMSFDNVLAIAEIVRGHSQERLLLVVGLLISLPIVVFGSNLVSRLMVRHRWIIWLGGAVLGHVAGEIVFKDPKIATFLGPQNVAAAHWVPWVLAGLLFALGWWTGRRKKN